jgi:hypothetical protein
MTQQISQPGQPATPYAPPAAPYVPTPRYGQDAAPAAQPVPQQYAPPPYTPAQPPAGPPAPPYGYGQPMGQPMGQSMGQPMAPAPKKRRTGLIIGAIVGVLVIAGLAVGAIFLFGSKSLDTAEAQTKIADLTHQQIGVTPTDVSCPQDVALKTGTTFHCTAKLDGQPITYTVKETDDQGNVRVDSDNNLILVSKVEQSVAQQVGDEAGVDATATCDTGGKKVLVDRQNTPIDCTVVNAEDDTDTLDVQATVDDQGNVSWTS